MSYFNREFVLFIVFAFSLNIIMTSIGANEGLVANAETVNQTITEIERLRQTVSAFDIFLNNFMIALLSAVPVVGLVFYVFVCYNTGFVYGNIGQYNGLSLTQTLSLAFSNEIAIIEYFAYAILVAESLYIIYLAVRKENVKERIKEHSWKSLLISCSLLLFGAFLEYFLIKTYG